MISFFRVVLLGTLLFALPAVADNSSLSTRYRQETQKVIDRLQAIGVQYIACILPMKYCLSPQDLSRELANTSYVELERFTKDPGAERWCAFYATNKHVIYLNKAAHHDPDLIGLLGIHELFGAIGRPETQFYLTMRIMEIMTTPTPRQAQLNKLKLNLEIRLPEDPTLSSQDSHLYLGGAVIIGGGGGDTATLGLRIQVYRELAKYFNQDYITSYLLDTVIEISKIPGAQIDYGKVTVMNFDFLKQVTVPFNLYKTKSFQNPGFSLAADEIAQYLIQMHSKDLPAAAVKP